MGVLRVICNCAAIGGEVLPGRRGGWHVVVGEGEGGGEGEGDGLSVRVAVRVRVMVRNKAVHN